MPVEEAVGPEASGSWKVGERLLLQQRDDWGSGQVDLARVMCAVSCGPCLDLVPWLQDSKMSLIAAVPFLSSPAFTREQRENGRKAVP